MDTAIVSIISAIITGGLALIGVIITNNSANKKVEQQLVTSNAVTNNKIENLTAEVKKHNDFASRIPVIEEKLKSQEQRIEKLEDKIQSMT